MAQNLSLEYKLPKAHIYTFASIHIHLYTHASGWKIGLQRVYSTWIWTRNMEDEDCTHHEAHFQEELESLKTSVARL
jgi:hypothetical protein